MNPTTAPYTPTEEQLAAQKAAQATTTGGTTDYIPGINVNNALQQLGSYIGLAPKADYDIFDDLTVSNREGQIIANPFQTGFGELAVLGATTGSEPAGTGTVLANPDQTQNTYNQLLAQQAASDKAYNAGQLSDQESQLRALLGRTDTLEGQGLDKILQEYNNQVTGAQGDRTKQLGNYGEQELTQGKNKVSAFDTIGSNANRAYRSLAQILGRASGTGSTAFQQLLPDVIGKDISAKRESTLGAYGENMQNIGKARNEYESDFSELLKDLSNQRGNAESAFKTGIGEKRQGINTSLMDVLAKQILNNNPNADYSTIKAQIAPLQQANETLSNEMEGYYNQYKPNYSPRAIAAKAPELSQFTVDRSNVNAQNQGVSDNPYANILRKRLQENG